MSDETNPSEALSPSVALLYAAHTAVLQRRSVIADERREERARNDRRPSDAHVEILGTCTRYLSLSVHAIEREVPGLGARVRRLSTMLTPGAIAPGLGADAIAFQFVWQSMAEAHKAQAAAIDLGAMRSLPDDGERALAMLLCASVLLLPTEDHPKRTPFDDELRRLVDPGGQLASVPVERRAMAAEGFLDAAEPELEDAIVVELTDAANRVRLSRRVLEGLSRTGMLATQTIKNRLHVRLVDVRRAVGLPLLFMSSDSARVDGEMRFDRGLVRFVRGPSPLSRGGLHDDGYLEFSPHTPMMVPEQAPRSKDFGLDHELLAMWVRAWSRERFGRALVIDERWQIVTGAAQLPGRVRSQVAFNLLGGSTF
jgi:hypothetical protein